MGLKSIAAQKAKTSNGLEVPFSLGTTPPTSGVGGSFAGRTAVGSMLTDSAGKLYIATAATATSVTWTLVGAQT
jgi:hypothetical protein